ncbi:hypothetical protein IQ06DRAFT_297151 [Phaeosphaeriaceae sp. SRC1lsM3a]|nr:hypothetical protein IQ06DRAFT_297151 [Stagonospora sp. SRC1lsM3a]
MFEGIEDSSDEEGSVGEDKKGGCAGADSESKEKEEVREKKDTEGEGEGEGRIVV